MQYFENKLNNGVTAWLEESNYMIDRESVLKIFRQLVAEKKFADALYCLGDTLLHLDHERDAIIDKAVAHRILNQDDLSAALLGEVLSVDITNLRALVEMALVEEKRHNFDDAFSWLAIAEKVNPRNIWPYLIRARILLQKGDYQPAVEFLQTAADQCKGYVIQREYDSCIRDLAFAKSAASREAARDWSVIASNPQRSGRPLENCLQVSMVKDEEDIIHDQLSSSYRAGLRYFVLADNRSKDNTRSEIDRFVVSHPDCIVYIVSDPVTGYYQNAKTTGLARLGKTIFDGLGKHIEWIIPLDADEFFHFSLDYDLFHVFEAATNQRKQLIFYYLCNASSETPLSKLEPGQDLRSVFPVVSHFRHHRTPKVAFRYSAEAYLDMGNHYAFNCASSAADIFIGAEHGLFLYHYPLRSLTHVKSKVLNGGPAFNVASGLEQYGGHWRAYYERYQKEGEGVFAEILEDYIARNRRLSSI